KQHQRSTLFPYTPLFRSRAVDRGEGKPTRQRGSQDAQSHFRDHVRGSLLMIGRAATNIAGRPERRWLERKLARWLDGPRGFAKLDRKSTRLNSSHVKISY